MKIKNCLGLTLVIYSLLAVGNSQSFWDDFKKNIDTFTNTITGFSCLATVTGEINDCRERAAETVPEKSEDRDKTTVCCAIQKFRRCVNYIAGKECGKEAEKVTESVVSGFARLFTDDDCVDYGFFACFVTEYLIYIAIGAALIFLLMCGCLCGCCCRSSKR